MTTSLPATGVNWIDTAAVHGLGHSEKVVAAALSGIPEADRPYVFTRGARAQGRGDRLQPDGLCARSRSVTG